MPSLFSESRTVMTITLLFMGVVFLVAGFFSWKQYERHQRIKAEVTVLEAERDRVRKENESLKERINYFATDEFKEQESKERLNMRKNNEYVVEIQQNSFQKKESEESAEQSANAVKSEPIPYYKKWWAKIFE